MLIQYCVFFPRVFNILRPLPRQPWAAAIGCTENGQPIIVTMYIQISDHMSSSPTCRGWDVIGKKAKFFNEHPVGFEEQIEGIRQRLIVKISPAFKTTTRSKNLAT